MADPSSEYMRWLLLITGNLRSENQNFATKLKNNFFSACLVLFLVFAFNCIILQECYSWKDKLECIQYLTTGIHIFTKHFNMILNGKKMNQFLDDVDRLWKDAQLVLTEKSLSVSKKTKKIIQGVLYFYLCYVLVSLFHIMFLNIMADGETENKYLLKFWVPNGDYYRTIFVIQFVITTSGLIGIATEIGLVFYIAGKLDILLECASKTMESAGGQESNLKAFQYHSDVLKLVRDINELFSGQYALEMILSSVQIALRIYSTINAIRVKSPDMFVSFFIALMTLVAPFSLCYLGNCVYTQGENLQRSVYFNQWYKKKINDRKNLITSQIISNKTITINYRNFIFFSYEEYLKLLQASYSYVMLTFSMFNEK